MKKFKLFSVLAVMALLQACVPVVDTSMPTMPVLQQFYADIDATKEESEVGCKIRVTIENTGNNTPKPHLAFSLLDANGSLISKGTALFDVIQVGQAQKKTIADVDSKCAEVDRLFITQGVMAVLGTPIIGVNGEVVKLKQVE